MNFTNQQDSDTFLIESTSNFYESDITGSELDLGNNPESQLNPAQPLSIEPLSAQETNSLESTELVFIDSAVKDIQTLTENISRPTDIIVLDGDRDELLQISEHLSNYEDLDAVHIVSHGEAGQLSFNNATLNSDTLSEYGELLEDWSLALDPEADLLLYGCDLTSSGEGESFVQELSQLTGADIAASVDITGKDSDWELETEFGQIETNSIFDHEIEGAYLHTLADGDISFNDLPDFNTDFSNTNIDFANIPVDNLSVFAEAGADFSTLDSNTISNIDFNSIPTEDLSILADAGFSLDPLSPDQISQFNLDTFSGLNYLPGIEFSSIESLGGDTTFAQLNDSVMANADLFAYKDSALSLDSGLTIDSLSQLSQSDLKALDYSFAGDEAFDGSYYLAENTDIRDAGVNPFTHYIESGASEGRDPNIFFDSSFYLEEYSDVQTSGINPFKHFAQSGLGEGRAPISSLGKPDQILIAQSIGDEAGGVNVIWAILGGLFEVGGNLGDSIFNSSEGGDTPLYTVTSEGDITTGTPPFEFLQDTDIRVIPFPGGINAEELLEGSLFTFPDESEIEFSGVVTTPGQTENFDELLENSVFTFPDDTGPDGTYFYSIDNSNFESSPQTGHPVLAEIEFISPGNAIIEASKPSMSNSLGIDQRYENPGQHDPNLRSPGRGNVKFNPTKSVLPDNHIELFNVSIPFTANNGRIFRYTQDESGVVHRFQPSSGNSNDYHWNGSTQSELIDGTSNKIRIEDVPPSIRQTFGI